MLLRLWLLAAVFCLLALAFAARLFQVQVLHGAAHARAVERTTLVRVHLPPRRGRILDRHGAAMADTRTVYHLALVLGDLALAGRARGAVPLWRLDGAACDAFIADLAGRVRWTDRGQDLRSVVEGILAAHPAVAVRRGRSRGGAALQLLALPRAAFADIDPEADAGRLAVSELLADDPADALAREIAAARDDPPDATIVLTAARAAALAAALDAESPGAGAALDPFLVGWTALVPWTAEAQQAVELRLLTADRWPQAVAVLARLTGDDPEAAAECLRRCLARLPPAPASAFVYAAGAAAEQVAALLPAGARAQPVAVPAPAGAREREYVIQGDPVGAPGLGASLWQRLADAAGCRPDLIAGLIERHGRRRTPSALERETGIRAAVLDPERVARLTAGLAAILTAAGRPTTVLDVEAAIAAVRQTVERGWSGQGMGDAIVAIRDLPHEAAVRLAGSDSRPPDDLAAAYDLDEAPLPGALLKLDVGRVWPTPESAPHVLGQVGRGTIEEGRLDALIGRSGLERTYDAYLRGVAGVETRMRTPDGVRVLHREPAIAGADLRTEIDMELQMLAEDSLARRYELAQALGTATPVMERALPVGRGRAGFALIDCQTGGILALASTPTIPIDRMAERITAVGDLQTRRRGSADPGERARLKEELAALSVPLHDYASEGDQPPGSSFKIITALCALEQSALTPGETIDCPGYMAIVGGRKLLRDHATGVFDLPHAIAVSSNVYFAKVAVRLDQKHGRGFLADWAGKVGLGRPNAYDVDQQRPRFPGDHRAGLLPTPANLAQVRPGEPAWLPSDSWRMSIGQFCTASPLQVVAIAAAVANGGRVVSPFLVRPRGQPEVVDLAIRAEYLAEVRHGMERVTEAGGTAAALRLDGAAAGIEVAAKTGTSEWGTAESREQGLTPDHGWMIGYAPADRPTVAFACFIHSGTFGGKACTPVVKRVLERYFAKYGRGGHAQGAVLPP